MENEKEEMIKLLKDHYGSSRDLYFIEEVAEFIEENIFEITNLYKDYMKKFNSD